jgi:hypothetical protein
MARERRPLERRLQGAAPGSRREPATRKPASNASPAPVVSVARIGVVATSKSKVLIAFAREHRRAL